MGETNLVENSHIIDKNLNDFSNLTLDSKSKSNNTEEEFQNFMHRVTEVEKIVKKLASTDIREQEQGLFLADDMLVTHEKNDISEDVEVKVKTNRTVINKYSPVDSDPSKMSQEAFKRSIEKDAKARAEDRKARNERAETYKRIGNSAFQEGNYEKAITYFTKAIEHRKDSTLIWNNRALTYMKLGLYEKALYDCEWALRVNKANIKALLNGAKCHKLLGNHDKCEEFISIAREKNPNSLGYISEFQQNLEVKPMVNDANDLKNIIMD